MRRKVQPKVYVAIKRIYVTSSPSRIENEISILEDLRFVPLLHLLRSAAA